jgi:hypothetical protein
MENINISVEERNIKVIVSGGRGPQGIPGITKLPVVNTSIPTLAYGYDHTVTITSTGADPTAAHTIALKNTNIIPVGIDIKKCWISALNTVTVTVANDGSGPESTDAFTLSIQVIIF